MQTLETEADLARALDLLCAAEPRFRAVLDRHGPPPLRRAERNLEALLRIVTDQLISLQAGAAIWRRIETELAPFDAHRLTSASEEDLMRLGLSRAKARSFRAAATAVVAGSLDFGSLGSLTDDEVRGKLLALHGIGPWTADIYLLSALGRADAWPAADLALQIAAHDLLQLPERPTAKAMARLAEAWRPFRSVAARLLWAHYRGLKGLPQNVA